MKKKKEFRLRSQYDADVYEGQVFLKPSLAEPNQALTPQEILNNFQLTGRTGLDDVFDEEGDIEDLAMMDKLEREDYRRGVASRIQDYQDRLEKQSQESQESQENQPVNIQSSAEPSPSS